MEDQASSHESKDVEVQYLHDAGELVVSGERHEGVRKEKEPRNDDDEYSSSFSTYGPGVVHDDEEINEKEMEAAMEKRADSRTSPNKLTKRRSFAALASAIESSSVPQATKEFLDLRNELESLRAMLEEERKQKVEGSRKNKKKKKAKKIAKRRLRHLSDTDEADQSYTPQDENAWEMEQFRPSDNSVDMSPIAPNGREAFFSNMAPVDFNQFDTSVDFQNTDLQELARRRVMEREEQGDEDSSDSSYDSSSDSDDNVRMLGNGPDGETTLGSTMYADDDDEEEEDLLYNLPSSSSSSSSDSEDVKDEEFIFVGNSKKFDKLRRKKRKKTKQAQQQSEAEAEGTNDEEGGGGNGQKDSDDEYYVRDSKPFYDYTQTVYGSFQKDLAANAKKFAEEIHRRKKSKPPGRFFEGFVDRVWRLEDTLKLESPHNFVWFFLICLGVLTACVGVAMDYAIIFILQGHYYVTDKFTDEYWLRFMIWTLYGLFFAGASMLSTRIAPTAQGSGIPEMKAILSGVNLRKYLTFQTLVAKLMSIVFSVGSGLVLGKVGPFIHACATMANQLARLPLFHRIRENGYLLQQMLAVGCTMGVASNFGAPVGGVLFSIEVTSTYYPLNTYASAFKCAIVGALVFRYFWFDTSYIPTNFEFNAWAYAEIPWFLLLGLVEGIVAAIFIHCFAKVVERRRWFASLTNSVTSPATKQFLTFCNHPYVYGMMVALLTAIVTFPGNFKFMSLPSLFALQDLFHDRPLEDNNVNAQDWGSGEELLIKLFLFMLSRFVFLSISLSMPLSSGVFFPLLVTGASMGRFWGEFLSLNLPQINYDINNVELFGWHIAPGGYALVGAAAFTGATTQAFSTAVIILEICGQLTFALPIVLTVVVAVSTARLFAISIYDKISLTRGLPWLPELPQSMYAMTVADIMKTNVQFLTYDATPQKIAKLLANPEKHKIYPIVNNASSMMVVGLVTRKDLLKYLLQSSTVRDWHTPVTMECNVSESRDVIPGLNEESRKVLPIKPATVQLFASTPLANCQMLFITLRLSDAFVTSNSKLVGIVTRNDLRMAIGQADFSPVINFVKGIVGGVCGVFCRRNN